MLYLSLLIKEERRKKEMIENDLKMYKEFRNCIDYEKKANELNTSRDVYYYDLMRCRSLEIKEVLDLVEYDESGVGHIDGCILIEVHHIYGYIESLEIPVSFDLEEWDEDEQLFMKESYTIKPYREW